MKTPKKPCAKAGCPELVPLQVRFCDKHQKELEQIRAKYLDKKRKTAHMRGYDNKWRKFRLGFLYRWLPYVSHCNMCLEPFKSTSDIHVDHIIPLSKGGAKYDEDNLQMLCHSCHSKKTILDSR